MHSLFHASLDHSVMDYLSRRFDDVLLISKVVLKGRLLSLRTLRPGEDVARYIKDDCGNDLCYADLGLVGPEEKEIGEIGLFLYRGKIIACIGEIKGRKIYGSKAIDFLKRLSSSETRGFIIRVYSFDQSLISEDLRRTILESAGATPGQDRVERLWGSGKDRDKDWVRTAGDPDIYVATRLGLICIPAVNVSIRRGGKQTLIDVFCDEESDIPPPKNIALATIKYYIEAVGVDKAKEKIKVVVHHKKIYTETYDLSRDTHVWRLLGSIPEIIQKYNLYVEKLKYNIKNNRALEISLMLKRYGIYSTANIYEVTKEIYNKLKQEWKEDLRVKAKIGAWGLEAKYP